MKKEKAIFFNNYILTAKATFEGMVREKVWGISEINGTIVEMNKEDFQQYYEEFIQELRENILEYQDIQFVDDYLVVCFSNFIKWDGGLSYTNQDIINGDFEVKFLKNLKHDIETYRNLLIDIYYGTEISSYSEKLKQLFDDTLKTPEQVELEKTIENNDNPRYERITDHPANDERFDFSKLKAESDELVDKIDKIKFVTERLYDLEQWELQNDNLLFDRHAKGYYEFSTQYYPNFKELCKTELMRYDKLLEIDKRKPSKSSFEVQPVPTNEPKSYQWSASDTDLLELIAALYQHKSIQRKDGKALTRKELIDYFQTIFGMDIKDVEGKLAKATNRKLNMTPFIDGLKSAFESYVNVKDEKQRKRK
jgi:hypothetical protein